MTFPQTITATQVNKETPIGEMFVDLTWAALLSHNPATTTGLTFGVNGGQMLVDGVLTTVADQTTLLAASTTNYVEATRAGVVSDNASGFSAGQIPLYTVTTSATGVSSFVDVRAWHDLPGVAGRVSVAVTTADVTLSAAQARCDIINVTGALTGNRALIVPNGPQGWCVTNNTTGAFTLTVRTSAGTGIAVTQARAAEVMADGTNVILSNNDVTAAGSVTSVDASGGLQTASGTPITSTGTIRGAHVVNAQTGVSYAVVAADRGRRVTLANAASIAASIAQAGTAGFEDGYFVYLEVTGVGAVTLTPTTSTVNGAATLVLTSGMTAVLFSDGTNYRAFVFDPQGVTVNLQTGTTYTYLSGDRGKLVTHTNAAAIAGTLPQAIAAFGAPWFTWVQNRGAGTLTITPTTSTIDGAATLALTTNQGALIVSDGTNYYTMRGIGGGGSGTGTKTYAVLTPMTSQPPAANFATLDTRNSLAVLEFDAATEEATFWECICPEAAALGSGLLAVVHWMGDTATTGDVVWGGAIERGTTDIDADSYDTEATATGTANGTSGIKTSTTITITTIDSLAAGDPFRFKLARKAASGSDTMAGDAQVRSVEIRSAA